MTITQPDVSTSTLRPVAFDLYRDIHKAIRSELFAVTTAAGQTDPSDALARTDLARHVASVMDFLERHAEHEDGAIQVHIQRELPDLAELIEADHAAFEATGQRCIALSVEAQQAPAGDERGLLHQLYVDLAAFTSAYLAHQDLEERLVMPSLEAAIGVDAVLGIHGQIIGGMVPEDLMQGLALMFPAMNVDDRTDLLGGMRATAPTEVFEGVWGLVRSVLCPDDVAVLSTRLGL